MDENEDFSDKGQSSFSVLSFNVSEILTAPVLGGLSYKILSMCLWRAYRYIHFINPGII